MKAILFDLDDTLYARQDPFCRAFRTVFNPEGTLFPALPPHLADDALEGRGLWAPGTPDALTKLYQSFLRHGYAVFEDAMTGRISMDEMYIYRIRESTKEIGFTLTDEQGLLFQAQYIWQLEHLQTGLVIAALLDECTAAGCFLGLVTNGTSEHQRMKYESMDLPRWIPREHVLASGDVGISKPDPEILRIAGKRWHLDPSDTWYVGDHFEHDIIPAAEVGWHTLWICRNESEKKYEEEGRKLTDRIVYTEEELLEAITEIVHGEKR